MSVKLYVALLEFVLVVFGRPAESSKSQAYLITTYTGNTSVVLKDRQLSEENGFFSVSSPSKCKCRSLCFVHDLCIVYSYNSSGSCVLSDRLGQTVEDSGATYEYQEQLQQLQDGLYYTSKLGDMPITDCEAACGLRGMIVPILRTRASLDAISQFVAWISLYRHEDRRWLWADGTELDRNALELTDTEPIVNQGADTFVVWEGRIDDEGRPRPCVCQGRFKNVV
ncbi:C-type lectin fold [Trinorchestia longiramus]|nr:C-type lectin fold [Trinorchestia longiramus]